MEILNKLNYSPEMNFTSNLIAKNFSVPKILQLRPELSCIITELIKSLPNRKYITVDYNEQILTIGRATCARPIWHVDGDGNNYALVCWGDFRTIFLRESISFDRKSTIPETSDEINTLLSNKAVPFFEIEEGSPIIYSSEDIHSGRVSTMNTKRILLRLCSSDYIRPYNKILQR